MMQWHAPLTNTELRQVVLIVRQDLNMKAGKIGAQCAHAAVGLYKLTVAQRAPWLSAWEVCKSISCP